MGTTIPEYWLSAFMVAGLSCVMGVSVLSAARAGSGLPSVTGGRFETFARLATAATYAAVTIVVIDIMSRGALGLPMVNVLVTLLLSVATVCLVVAATSMITDGIRREGGVSFVVLMSFPATAFIVLFAVERLSVLFGW